MCIFRDLQQKSSEELNMDVQQNRSDGLTVYEFEHLYQCLELRWEIAVRMNLIELVCYYHNTPQTDTETGKVLAWYKCTRIPNKLQTTMESKATDTLYNIYIILNHDPMAHTAEMHIAINYWLFNTIMSKYQ